MRQYPTQQADLIGHSMGGLVLDAALRGIAVLGNTEQPPLQNIDSYLKLGTPYNGSGIAHQLANEPEGSQLLRALSFIMGHTPNAPAYTDVSPNSRFLQALHSAPERTDIRQMTIGAYKTTDIIKAIYDEALLSDLFVALSRCRDTNQPFGIIENAHHGDLVGLFVSNPEIPKLIASAANAFADNNLRTVKSSMPIIYPGDNIFEKLNTIGLGDSLSGSLDIRVLDENSSQLAMPLYLHTANGAIRLVQNPETGVNYYSSQTGQNGFLRGVDLPIGTYSIKTGDSILTSDITKATVNPLGRNYIEVHRVNTANASAVVETQNVRLEIPAKTFEGSAFVSLNVTSTDGLPNLEGVISDVYSIEPSAVPLQGKKIAVTLPFDSTSFDPKNVDVYALHKGSSQWEKVEGPYVISGNYVTFQEGNFSYFVVAQGQPIVDLVLVARDFGKSEANLPTDVNKDGTVNVVDLVTVARQFGNSSLIAAPSKSLRFSADEKARAYAAADALRYEGYGSVADYLEKVVDSAGLAGRISESKLLPNFPNPFNPETWIPYQLAEDASRVEVGVYTARGELVRRFDLGERRKGVYVDRSSALYWDGRNEIGESVSGGIYYALFRVFDGTKLIRTDTRRLVEGK